MNNNHDLTYDQARAQLQEWADCNAKLRAGRDEQIRRAWRAHMSKTEIAKVMDIDRGVVIRVLAGEPARPGDDESSEEG